MPDKSIPDKASTKRGFGFRVLYVHESTFRRSLRHPKPGGQGFTSHYRPCLSTIRRFGFAKYSNLADTSFQGHMYVLIKYSSSARRFSMQVNTTKCRTSIRLAIGVVFLVIAVFGWGAKYKISLYDPPGSVSTHMSQAKLLSQKERPVLSGKLDPVRLPLLQAQSSIAYPAFLIAALLLGSQFIASLWMLTEATDHGSYRQRWSNSIYFSFRPPPALLPSLPIR